MRDGGGMDADHGIGASELRAPPCATSVTDKLPDYWFRLAVVPEGSFFSILPVMAVLRPPVHARLARARREQTTG
jgi:hypothetical protein